MHSKQQGLSGINEGVAVEPPSRSDGVTAGIEGVSALTDDELLAGTRRLACVSNRVLAALLAHLAEVEARGLHRQRACSSVYTYCIYELRMPEDTAYRRVAAARFVKRFPLLLSAIERGELHLTGVLLLGPHLTEANVAGVLERAKFRTKKEILKLVRLLSPLPDVPSRIEPLGLARPAHPFSRPTWSNFVASLCPVRELLPDERPSNWLPPSESNDALGFGIEGASFAPLSVDPNSFRAAVSDERAAAQLAPARDEAILFAVPSQPAAPATGRADFLTSSVDAVEPSVPESAPLEPALARHPTMLALPSAHIARALAGGDLLTSSANTAERSVPEPASSKPAPARDGTMLSVPSAQSEHAVARPELLTSSANAAERSVPESAPSEPASARVQHAAEHLSGPQRYKVQFTASEEYVALVEEAKALLAHALPRADLAEIHLRALRTLVTALKKRKYATPTPGSKAVAPAAGSPASSFHDATSAESPSAQEAQHSDESAASPRQRGRYVPAAVRRAVFERDENRCAYVDARGERCRETSRLELHHHEPFARGGPATPENLSLYCAAHNALAAEQDFGAAVTVARRDHPHFTERRLMHEVTPIQHPRSATPANRNE